MELKNVIEQRKTIKVFNPHVSIERQVLEEMLMLAQLAPSKANLQPWRFVVVDDTVQKNKLLGSVAFNAPPCETASAVILVLADLQYQLLLDDILECSIETGCLHPQFKQRSLDFLLSVHNASSEQDIRDQVITDTSLAAMQLMLIAKDKGYDTHAIGVFDCSAVLAALEVDADRYLPVMLLAIGKAATAALPSSRLSLDYTVSWNNGKGFKK
ncbi:putative NAD(P)H nitroreductase [Actinobacillus ureae]|uniref:Nitroreductase family protein n=1 Tax=Actinobacillus ureae ATCC 25976 TaxID=887324 RepID=E8KFE2_9PAST|nr:nitroreductase family protein [Actinobacillus ureae]EFX92386.1 nitroreductase family protein [Actinobacillus ureae ATCC 25976]SUT85553.1 putative NAD(P)H nitroreductase [Actinobacillus ureae]SUU43022.1 putative NAD(P)H nitroreductase [Actinobacillus ureae]